MSVIDGREILATIQSVVDNVTLAVTVVGTLVVFSGLLILVGAVAMTKFRRVYEAAIFKTLGRHAAADRGRAAARVRAPGRCWRAASAPSAPSALTWGISRFALDIPFRPLVGLTVTGVVVTAMLVAAMGVAASWDVLQRKPLATLRGRIAGGRGRRAWYHQVFAATPGGRSWSQNSMNVSVFKDALLKKRAELVQTAGIKPLQSSMEHNNGRQGDMADQATGNNEVHIQLRLKQTDAKILQAIDEALAADRQGRLRPLPGLRRAHRGSAARTPFPWTRVCITCKEKQKA